MKKYFNFHYTIIKKKIVVNAWGGLLILSALATSCKRLVEIPGNPPTEISEAQQFGDSATAMTAIAGVYTYASSGGGFTYNDGYLSICTGMSSDELATSQSSLDAKEFYGYSLTSLNGYINSLWNNPYKGVYPVNAILTEVPNSPALTTSFKTQIVGEMKVLRSVYYFYLLNLFGDVPLITGTDYKVNTYVGRTPEDSIYNQIIRDLTDAGRDLSADYPSDGRVRPNKNVATAFLAKVYLYRQQWQQAYDAAGTVISSGGYHLETDLNKVFLDGSQEAIWQLPATSSNTITREGGNFIPFSSTVTPNYPITSFLLNAFETGDQRLQKWTGSVTLSGSIVYYPYKYKNWTFPPPLNEDFMIFRLAEQYLIRAEAAAHLGHGADALADVNTIRARAGLGASTADPSDQTAVLNAIMHERQVELFTEWGNRWCDLKRTGMATTILGSEKTRYVPADSLYPLPYTQLQLNPLLQQNPGYN